MKTSEANKSFYNLLHITEIIPDQTRPAGNSFGDLWTSQLRVASVPACNTKYRRPPGSQERHAAAKTRQSPHFVPVDDLNQKKKNTMLRWTLHLKGAPNSEDNNHAAVAVWGGRRVYFFGGSEKKEEVEVHVFNTVSLRWAKLLPPALAGKGDDDDHKQTDEKDEEELHLLAAVTGEAPSRSGGHTAAIVDDAVVYVWGRFFLPPPSDEEQSQQQQQQHHRNTLYAFDVHLHRWSKPRASGSAPPGGGRGHSACVLGRTMYVFGGYSNDLHALDTDAMLWSFIQASPDGAGGEEEAVPASSWHSATFIGARMLVFGGLGHQDPDVRVFDAEAGRWLSRRRTDGEEEEQPDSPHRLIPEERYGHSAFAHRGDLYVYGGIHQGTGVNDLWRYSSGGSSDAGGASSSSSRWTRVEPRGRPGPSQNCWMCCVKVGPDRVLLFDDDLYVLDLSPSLRTLAQLAVAARQVHGPPGGPADLQTVPTVPGDRRTAAVVGNGWDSPEVDGSESSDSPAVAGLDPRASQRTLPPHDGVGGRWPDGMSCGQGSDEGGVRDEDRLGQNSPEGPPLPPPGLLLDQGEDEDFPEELEEPWPPLAIDRKRGRRRRRSVGALATSLIHWMAALFKTKRKISSRKKDIEPV